MPVKVLLPAPPLGRLALPRLAPAPPADLGNALCRRRAHSQSPPPTTSATSSSAAATAHLLPSPPQPPSPPLPSSVLAFCRLSGKRRGSEICLPVRPSNKPPTVAPRPRGGFSELGIGRGQRRSPSLRPQRLGAGTGEAWKGTRARDARTRVSACFGVCVCWGPHDPLRTNPGEGEAVPLGWGTDGGDLGEGSSLLSISAFCRNGRGSMFFFGGVLMTTLKTESEIGFLYPCLLSARRKIRIGF